MRGLSARVAKLEGTAQVDEWGPFLDALPDDDLARLERLVEGQPATIEWAASLPPADAAFLDDLIARRKAQCAI